MAEIYAAYSFLNKSLGLKLSPGDLVRAEREFKRSFAIKMGFDVSDDQKVDDLEFLGYLVPRKRARAKASKGAKPRVVKSKVPK